MHGGALVTDRLGEVSLQCARLGDPVVGRRQGRVVTKRRLPLPDRLLGVTLLRPQQAEAVVDRREVG